MRAVVFDEQGRVPILFVSKRNYHKLPGGGIEVGETKMEALAREIEEETGCTIEVEGELGKVIEYRSKHQLKQISYCYYGKVLSKGEPHYTTKELKRGFELKWLILDEAIKKIKTDKPQSYSGKFIQKRDLRVLEENVIKK